MPGTTTSGNHNDQNARDTLLRQVQAKRTDVDRYLEATGRRRHRLVQVTIAGGAIAAALTASTALGGQPLADWLAATFALPAPAWQILCGVAAVCSVAATIAGQMHKSHNYDEHIARAQGVRADLEALALGLQSGHIDRRQAAEQLIESVRGATFLGPSEQR